MLNIGDYVLHQKIGQVGQVLGYGHQVMNGTYITTLKVRFRNQSETPGYRGFMEDVYTNWILAETVLN
ncbi:MAG: hypothetical protein KME55_03055 [Nostoc indistinguendum CM1-VF10]|jgi:hypothetical protein|nr:hypothetical protein [Nostoc indistinguendum CM1-VF10]